jgi:transcriptional regulator with XRE-family HTH domain
MESAAQLIKDIMDERGIRMVEMAALLGTSQSTISRIVNGEVEPRLATYRKLLELRQDTAA